MLNCFQSKIRQNLHEDWRSFYEYRYLALFKTFCFDFTNVKFPQKISKATGSSSFSSHQSLLRSKILASYLFTLIKTLKDLLIDVIIEKEKSGYIIGKFSKSIPNSEDQHPEMEIG